MVLLDEFEKAHPRVWDLFLQVFDDGRLTDAQGNLADFRHSIIILTSNLGATQHRAASLGLQPGGRRASREQQILRVIAETFRPEFVNRLDRVVVFRPLTPHGDARDPEEGAAQRAADGAASATASGRWSGRSPRSSSCSTKASRQTWARARCGEPSSSTCWRRSP